MRQRLGQHFLNDLSVVDEIVQAAELRKNDTVFEVGPGKGILTQALVRGAKKVIAVEKDGDLHYHLKKKFKDNTNLELIYGDIRNFNLDSLPKKYKIVANIPYYLSGKLIQDFLSTSNPPSLVVLMLQKEVAERLTAPAGQSSLLQLTSSVFAEIAKLSVISKDKFSPAPEVDSAIVVFKLRPKPLVSRLEQGVFFRLLKFAFAGKRKKLTNTLAGALKVSSAQILDVLKSCSFSNNVRPQELDVFQWICLYTSLLSKGLI